MNFENENNAEERRKTNSPSDKDQRDAVGGAPRRKSSKRKNPASPEVGQALRNIYQHTIEEDIPSEMLDLLGKLG